MRLRAHGIDDRDLRRYADLILRCGANVEAGQKVLITGDVEHAYLIAALAERAYANGASLAETFYFDDRVLAAQAAGAPTDELAAAVPGWLRGHVPDRDRRALGAHPHARRPARRPLRRGAGRARDRAADRRLAAGLPHDPGAHQLEPVRLPDRRPGRGASTASPTSSGCGATCATPCASTSPTRIAAWDARRDELLLARRRALDEAGFAALRFRGGGTDLFVPLHRDARWQPAWLTTSWGRRFLCNLPSEEIYVAPDFRGVQRHRRRHPPGHRERRAGHGPRAALRGRPRRRRRRRRQRRRRCAPASPRTAAPAASARWRWSTRRRGSGGWASSSRRRCSTRTPPVTSPGAPPSTTRFPTGCPTTRPPSRRAA